MHRILKLMADYDCFPLWEELHEGLENINPEDLNLNDETKLALYRWAESFDATLNRENPADSGFPNEKELESFENEGRRLWKNLKKELGAEFHIRYFSIKDGETIQ